VCRIRYGAHLSREQVADLVAPHPDTLKLVYSWLTYNGVPPSSISTTHGSGWLTVAGVPVSRANELLGASYQLFYHAWTNETILRTVSYALPAALHMHVKTVVPTTAFTSTRLLQQTPRSRSSGEAVQAAANVASGEPSDVLSRRDVPYVEPSSLRWQYNTFFYEPAPTNRNVLGIAGLSDQKPSPEDQLSFMNRFSAGADAAIVTVVPVNGGVNDQSPPGQRGNFDTQYSVALTYPTPVVYYTMGGRQKISPSGEPSPGDQYLE
jgi:tripeptidyl-peptidase-1